MKKIHTLYELTEEDVEIFDAGVENVTNFTDFYFRTETSGTIYELDDPRYDEILGIWKSYGKTEELFELEDDAWGVVWSRSTPVFRRHHGIRPIPWGEFIFHCMQTLRVIAGGFSSGKSFQMVVEALVLAATVEEFKAMCTAPSFFQAKILYKLAQAIYSNTPYEQRFVVNAVESPFPIITIGNSHVGYSTIEFKSASDDGDSLLSWRGDWAMIDQAELIPNVSLLRKNLGSRLVGKSPMGRKYMGIQNWLANAGPSPGLWELYDLAGSDPENCVSLTVTSYDNPHNSADDLRRLERDVGGINRDGTKNQDAIDQWLLAKRPAARGVHFSNDTMNLCRDKAMERRMATSIAEGRDGYIFDEDSTGIYRWMYPYEPSRLYMVVGDPGHANRPDRNSPVIMVWDITEWPRVATLAGFYWMDGKASITPFISEFAYLVEKYHAHGQCAFDSTGVQKIMDELAFELSNLMVHGLNFSKHKMLMLNSLKLIMERGKLKIPYIGGLWQQLLGYDLPDTKLKQDIVSCMMMSAFWLRDRLGMEQHETQGTDAVFDDSGGRFDHDVSPRYPRAPRDEDLGPEERRGALSPAPGTFTIMPTRENLGFPEGV